MSSGASDKWCEQGSCNKLAATSGWTSMTVDLLKSYKDIDYSIIVLGNWSDPQSSSAYITAKTVSQFKATLASNNATQHGVWHCNGYLT